MGKKRSLLNIILKISNDLDRAKKRQQREEQKRIRQEKKGSIRFEKIHEKQMKVIVKEKEKAVAQHEKEIKTNLTAQTIKAYSLGKRDIVNSCG